MSCFLLRTSQNLPLYLVQLAEWADYHAEADLYNLADSEALEDDLPKIEATHELFMNDGTKGSELDGNSSVSSDVLGLAWAWLWWAWAQAQACIPYMVIISESFKICSRTTLE